MPSLMQRLKADPALRAKYLANPGLRSKLPASMLTATQRKQRAQNTAGRKPVTPGSKLTAAELAREAQAAASVRYGPQERALGVEHARETQRGTDMAGFYEQYQRELAQHSANTQQINAQAVSQMGATAASLRGLDQSGLAANQQQADASAQQRGATAGNQGPDASNASLVRQQALAGFINQQSATGAATNRYADTRARVVAPQQALQARAQSARRVRDIGERQTGLAADRGAFDSQYRSGRTADEAKNVLAMQAMGVGLEKAQIASDDRRKSRVTSNRNADASRALSAQTSAERLAQSRERIALSKAKAGKTGAGTAAQRARADKALTSIRTAAADIRDNRGKPQPKRDAAGKPVPGQTYVPSDAEIRAGLRRRYKDVDIANAAMDLATNGYVSPENVRRLRRRGISVPASLRRKPPQSAGAKKATGVEGFLPGAAAGAVK